MAETNNEELIVHSQGEDGFVEVTPKDTLSQVRLRILEDLDEEQLPAKEFSFKVNGIRISAKQEARKLAFDLLAKQAKIELVPKRNTRKMDQAEMFEHNDHPKRAKTTRTSFITPTDEPTQTLQANKPIPIQLDQKLSEQDEDDNKEASGMALETPAETNAKAPPESFQWPDGGDNEPPPLDRASADVSVPSDSHKHPFSSPMTDSREDTSEKVTRNGAPKESSPVSLTNETKDLSAAIDAETVDFVDTNDSGDDDIEQVLMESNLHQDAEMAQGKSREVLERLATLFHENPIVCSDARRKEWQQEIQELEERNTPQTIFGVLGNTGVGKSSLLNALLDEAAVLPTSGSRGCTATVVELVFHSGLTKQVDNDAPQQEEMIPVYQGKVEFITLADWQKELKILVDECSTQNKTIYQRPPIEESQAAAAAAWQKIEQVYGKFQRNGTTRFMEQFHTRPTHDVYSILANHPRVRDLLTPTEPGKEYNAIHVGVGEVAVGSDEAKELLKPFGQMKARTKRKKKQWAQEFRKEINSFVYRKGNGEQPQTWPLIRKVQLRGPWSVLATGAILVDLPGVRDSNAARAKVAENYLQNCNQIAIVAPIKRAVDDGTAKELLGEQFKRRLLMDGQYGNVFFICTQTDDLEATETMRDHADVAQQEPGRWEKMTELASSISNLEKQIYDKLQDEEDLECQVQETVLQLKDQLRRKPVPVFDTLTNIIATHNAACINAKDELLEWRVENRGAMEIDREKCSKLQKKLKPMCATVRNEYSKSCLQEDFRSGLKELYRKDDDDDGNTDDNQQSALPEDFNMDVFCISSNDYLKLMKIKPSRDGPPNTFSSSRDTQIPQLRAFVHETTSSYCKSYAKTFMENTNDLLDRLKLLATDSANVPTGRSAYRMKSQFERKMKKLDKKIHPIADNFKKVLDQKIQQSLLRSLQTGARKGSSVAMDTVNSWGSKNYRTKSEQRSDKNGLYYSTYQAVLRRGGAFNSASAGGVDFNQELCDPMEKEFSADWQAVLDSTIRRLLSEAEKTVLQICNKAILSLASKFRENGVDAARLSSMLNTANRSTITAVKILFQQMGSTAVAAQRDLSRTLLPAVQQQMNSTYESCLMVPRGSGTFSRMKAAMATNSQEAVNGMFDDAMKKLLDGIESVIKQLTAMIASTTVTISKIMESTFSICWDDQSGKENLMNPVMQKKIRECRDAVLPELNELCEIQGEACTLLGIEREEFELDVMAVESLEQSLERKLEEAKMKGDAFDLCDSDAEIPVVPKTKVKSERVATSASQPSRAMQSTMEVIDLCDSDDDWETPAASCRPPTALKSEDR